MIGRAMRRGGGGVDLAGIALAPLGIALVAVAQAGDGVDVTTLLQGPAALVVFGGTLSAILTSFSLSEVCNAIKAAARSFEGADNDRQQVAASLVALAIRVHRRGLVAIEPDIETVADPYLRHGLTLAVDGTPIETLRELLALERHARYAEEESAARVFESAAGYAPTLGILGAVLGLIDVMKHLAEPAALGQGIAVAFVATVYGVGAANLLLLPIAGRIRARAAAQARRWELMTEGICAIQQRLHPRLVAHRLRAFARDMPRIDEIAARVGGMTMPPRLPA